MQSCCCKRIQPRNCCQRLVHQETTNLLYQLVATQTDAQSLFCLGNPTICSLILLNLGKKQKHKRTRVNSLLLCSRIVVSAKNHREQRAPKHPTKGSSLDWSWICVLLSKTGTATRDRETCYGNTRVVWSMSPQTAGNHSNFSSRARQKMVLCLTAEINEPRKNGVVILGQMQLSSAVVQALFWHKNTKVLFRTFVHTSRQQRVRSCFWLINELSQAKRKYQTWSIETKVAH